MAIAPIEVTLPGLSNYALTMDLFAYGAAQNAVAVVSGLVLTADTQQPDKYWTTTAAALSGLHSVVVKEGSTIRGRGFVLMDDSTGVHRVDGSPFIGNISATGITTVTVGVGAGAYILTITVLDDLSVPIQGALVGIFRSGDSRQGTTDVNGQVVFNTGEVTWNSVSIVSANFTFATAPIVVVGNTSVTFTGVTTQTLPNPMSADTVHGIGNVYNELGQLESDVKVFVQMVKPSDVPGIYDGKIRETLSVNGVVTILNLFQGATYHIWRGLSERLEYVVPITNAVSVNLPPIVGKDF